MRSMTFTFTTSSSARRWLGASSVSAMTVSAPTRRDDVAQLLRLAAAEVGAGVRVRAPLQQAVEHDRAGGLGERGELAQRVLGVVQRALRVDADQHDVLEPQLPVLDLGDVLELGGEPGDAAQRLALLAVELLAVEARRALASMRAEVGAVWCRSTPVLPCEHAATVFDVGVVIAIVIGHDRVT